MKTESHKVAVTVLVIKLTEMHLPLFLECVCAVPRGGVPVLEDPKIDRDSFSECHIKLVGPWLARSLKMKVGSGRSWAVVSAWVGL